MENKDVIVYDVCTLPTGMSLEDLFKIKVNAKVLFYDSSLYGGNAPFVTNSTEEIVIANVKLAENKKWLEDKLQELKEKEDYGKL